jgi:hypothetical protein
MKISEKFEKYLITEAWKQIAQSAKRITVDLISLIFALQASRRFPSAVLLKVRHRPL